MSENVTLPRNQRRALTALLASRSITEAAAACRLSEKTLYRYLELPEFRQALTQAESGLIDEAGRRLVAGQDKALNALEFLIRGLAVKDSDRRLASQAWMDLVFRWRELRNTEQRLADLEAAVYGNHK